MYQPPKTSAPANDAPFSNKTLFWIILLGILATLGVAVTSVFQGDGRYETSAGTNSFSKSAVGHAAWVELLKSDGWRMLQSQHNTFDKLNEKAALFLLEPVGPPGRKRINDLIDFSPMLVVLPKRRTGPHPFKAGWIGSQHLLPARTPQTIAQNLLEDAEVIRPDATPKNWQHDFSATAVPDIDDLQLIKSDLLAPIIATGDGILFGKLKLAGAQPVWVLSDPDLIATHGLARGWNAAIAQTVAQTVAEGTDTIIIDEVVHGFTATPSLGKAMFEHPFVYLTIAGLLALMVFLLAQTRRFGAPWRANVEVADSKTVFVENAARILHLAEKEQEALLRLMDDQALEVARKLRAPSELERNRLEAWLDDQGQKRGISVTFSTIRRRVQRIREDDDSRQHRLLIHANQFYTWRQEMLNDPK
ncbi:hypothetical protein [Kordiimonas aestuarii]|uniref:hypothetical protein n=1 Tax=Kordiimonas aestuarii TaxID=1005925 RepID=UPI0021CFB0CF|nr:hypothetical protein [Kordiimonas aestuarii]